MNAHAVGIRIPAASHAFESRGADLGERVSAFLRAKHPAKTAFNVSADTGGRVPVNTIKTWLQRGSAPDADGYTELWLAYGIEFLAALADRRAPEWLIEARRNYEALLLKQEIARLELKLAKVKS